MKILIANPGSTSYKCKLFDMQILKPLFQIAIERIGEQQGVYHYQFDDSDERSITQQIPDYFAAVNISIQALEQKYALEEISAIGFKVVLAKNITGCVELTDDVLSAMREYLPLAPVHNQIYLTAISCFQKIVADIPLVGLFETAFHADIPPEAYLYGIPFEFYEKYGIRKYGFHGASHRYIAEYVTDCYGQNSEQLKIISCHLGGSSSVCAIRNGKSIDTTMGMSPQCGLLNAKRVGDLDSFALLYLMEKQGLTIPAARELLIQRSGVVGISGLSGDFRDIEQAMNRGHQQARLAFNTFAYVVKRYIGQYLAIMNGADYIVFTGGLGQNSSLMRHTILNNMGNLGIMLDEKKNQSNPAEGIISAENSKVKVAIVPTNEELVVASSVQEFIIRRHTAK